MTRNWESYKRKREWRYAGWRRTVFTDMILDTIFYLGYCGEASSIRDMARSLGCNDSHAKQEIVTLLDKIGCITIMPYKGSKRIRLNEKGWRVFVLMEAIHIVLEQDNQDLINLG